MLDIAAMGPASLIFSAVSLGGVHREVTDYWELIYSSALRHNIGIKYWVILNPPIEVPGLDRPVHVVELVPPQEDEELLISIEQEAKAQLVETFGRASSNKP